MVLWCGTPSHRIFCARFRAVAMLIQTIFPLAKMLLSTRGIRSQDRILFKLNLREIFFPYRDDLVVSVIYGTASSKTQVTASGMHQWLLYLVELNFLTCICTSFVVNLFESRGFFQSCHLASTISTFQCGINIHHNREWHPHVCGTVHQVVRTAWGQPLGSPCMRCCSILTFLAHDLNKPHNTLTLSYSVAPFTLSFWFILTH